jgi:beta-glucosidase
VINDSALRIIRTMLAFVDAEKEQNKYDESVLACKEHVELALKSAREGITLIQNKNNVLPISRDKAKKIVVLGKLAEKENIGDHGSSRVYPPYAVTPMQGITKAAPESEVVFYNGEDIEQAKKLASNADEVIFIVGFDHDDEGEFVSENEEDNYTGAKGGDRKVSLGLHEDEIKLVKEVGPVNANSTAVLIGGNMIMIDEWKDSVSAILMAYYPGMEGGTAIAEILFGDVNPSGKLPFVIVKNEEDLPYVNWDTQYQHYDYYHGYTKLDKEGIEPSVPYGFGMSYTTFKVSQPEFSASENGITAKCKVANTGDRAGDEVVQLYVGFENSKVDRPVKILRGFERVSLEAGESKTVEITCPIEELKWYDSNHNEFVLDHMEYQVYVGTSSSNSDLLKGTVTL